MSGGSLSHTFDWRKRGHEPLINTCRHCLGTIVDDVSTGVTVWALVANGSGALTLEQRGACPARHGPHEPLRVGHDHLG